MRGHERLCVLLDNWETVSVIAVVSCDVSAFSEFHLALSIRSCFFGTFRLSLLITPLDSYVGQIKNLYNAAADTARSRCRG